MRYFCLGAFCLMGIFILSPRLYAQRQQALKFERITIEQGLSQNTVFAVLQDSKGFLWFGTEDGLNRYDGYTFKVYRHNPDDPGTLSNNMVRVIYEDRSGTIWIGTRGGGLNKFDRKTESFTGYTFQASTKNCLSDNMVWTICGGEPGVLWIGTNKGLNRFQCETGIFTHWLHEPDNARSLSSNMIKALCEDGSGGLWIGTGGGGLNRLVFNSREASGKEIGTFMRYKHHPDKPGSLSHNDVYAIYLDKSGALWVGTYNGLNKFDSRKDVFIDYTNRLKVTTPITSITGEYSGNANILWIGTYGDGLFRFDGRQGTFTQYVYTPGTLTSLSNNRIQGIYIDNSGILWVGTDSGLNKFGKKKQTFGHWDMIPDAPNSVSNNNIWSIFKDRKGILWLGSESGLRQLNRINNKCTPVKIGTDENNNLKILTMCEDRSGFLWIGVYAGGLYKFDPGKGTFTHYEHDPFNPGSISHNQINTIHADRKGILWVGTGRGLNKFDDREQVFTAYGNTPDRNDSLSHDHVNAIYVDRSNTIWVGTEGGLNLFRSDSGTFTRWKNEPGNPDSLTSDKVSSFYEDQDGMLWIGTWGGGLNRFDRTKKAFTHYLEKDGLPNEYIYGILGDDEGCIWMSTNKGISRFDPKSNTFKNYDARDGLQSNEFNAGAFYRSADGEMFFGGINGFNAFYPHEIKDNPHVPPIVITAIQIMNEPVDIGPNSPLKQSIMETKEIVLSYRDYFFSFDFAALDFSNPEKNKYAYKMDGFDREWIYTDSKRRFANYTNLDPGEYTFRVKGANNDGVWNEEGTAINIVIVPPITRTWWFQLLAIAVFTALSYWLINFVKKYIAFSGFWKREKYIGKFKLLEKIGTGGMGTIYKAKDTTQRIGTVALKVLKDELYIDENYRKRFKQEAAIIDQLDHPNIVKVIERGQFEQKLFIVMELLEGKTLAMKISQEKTIDIPEVIDIMCQVSAALVKIHNKNIIHRDLKPENIMLIEKDGNCNFVKLLDFGLAKTAHQTRITQTGTVLGTLNYMAPEQIAIGRFSRASDVYSLGVIFYEALTGNIPFPGDNVTDSMRQILNETPVEPIRLRPDLPDRFNYLVLRMIEKGSDDRPTAKEVLNELQCFGLKQTIREEED